MLLVLILKVKQCNEEANRKITNWEPRHGDVIIVRCVIMRLNCTMNQILMENFRT